MNDKIKKSPQLRFRGFTGDWEERKLGELGSVLMNKRIFKEETSESGDVPFYKIGTFGGEPDAYISRELFEEYKAKYPYPELGDILISASGSIGRTVVYQGGEEYFQDSNIVWLNHDERLDNTFLKQFYLIVKWQGLEGSTIKRLYNKNILNTKINLPMPSEQKKVGILFNELDNLLTLHQRKLDLLKSTKKSMLQKMFPKNGETVPEIRFKGFTGDWEERKFSEIFIYLKNNSLSRADLNYEKGLIKNVHYGDVLIKFGEILDVESAELPFISNNKFTVSHTSLLQNGDVVIADAAEDNTVGKCSELKGIDSTNVVSGLHTIPCRPNKAFSSGYLGYYLNSNAFHNQLLPLIQGTKVSSISKSALLNTDIIYPNSEQEQLQIGQYFSNLDNLITHHQRKLDLLKALKKSLLQQMFI